MVPSHGESGTTSEMEETKIELDVEPLISEAISDTRFEWHMTPVDMVTGVGF